MHTDRREVIGLSSRLFAAGDWERLGRYPRAQQENHEQGIRQHWA
jgi:hypothetical protein